MEMKARKQALRKQVLAQRQTLSEQERCERSAKAVQFLMQFEDLAACKTVMVFYPFRDEIDTRPFLAHAQKRGQEVWLPYTDMENKRIIPYVYTGEDCLKLGTYGIYEPDIARCEPADVAKLDAVVLPGVAFDRSGGRMGYGAGYYDRFLAGLPGVPLLIGLSFDVQVVDEVPTEPHDFRVPYIATESGISATFPPQFERS
ncbi:5-formyltetrahydrofolate cyclo-ligase [Brevibacillus fluminis]|uniref:5-formyltetrahydrofolate cyclo-ligase n=1 Tax=Brevibacillus fluminis TaxID=511487 RepID=A0A3M8DX04_9BACL|nr:5-formyltetrahydrofolate cyclo-ligase [Brevibacillus fluminis]RNB91507.1 5-formyltetrahydrofolate cyclo-ligase [Brevibacillus fluminis]